MVYWGENDEDDLLNTLDHIRERLKNVGMFVAARECVLFQTSIPLRGKVYLQGQVQHDPDCLSGLANTRRPATCVFKPSWGRRVGK